MTSPCPPSTIPSLDTPAPSDASEQEAARRWFMTQAAWHRAQAEGFEAGDPRDPQLALAALHVWEKHPGWRHGYACDASGWYGPLRLDTYNLARAKGLMQVEARHYRSAMCLLVAFAGGRGIDASPLLNEDNETLVLRVKAAIQVGLAGLPLKDRAAPTKRKPSILKNDKRDAWVARQREKNPPVPWEEIYDEASRLMAKRGWDLPGNWRGLEEAHRRYLKRQRGLAES
jgi:hypothetical protein